MRVAVVGAGALGSYHAALLARAGHDVTLLARAAHLPALRATGVVLRSGVHGDVAVAVPATDRPEEIGPVDLVLVCVKTYDLDAAAAQLAPLLGPETAVLPLQNGVEATERLAQRRGPGARAVAGRPTSPPARGAGRRAPRGGERLDFGEPAGGPQRAHRPPRRGIPRRRDRGRGAPGQAGGAVGEVRRGLRDGRGPGAHPPAGRAGAGLPGDAGLLGRHRR